MIEICILTDHLHEYEANPQKLIDLIRAGSYGADTRLQSGNGIQVMPYHHADYACLTMAHRNYFDVLSEGNIRRKLEDGWFEGAEFRVGVLEERLREAQDILTRAKKELAKVRKKYPKPKKAKK